MTLDRAWRRNQHARDVSQIAVDEVTRGDLAAAEAAFDATPGGFADKLIAAVTAATLANVEYETEKHVRIPDNPESLTLAELDALVRPFSDRVLCAHTSEAELLEELEAIASRQQQHAQWAPFEFIDPLPPPPRPSPGHVLSMATPQDRARRAAYEQHRDEYIQQL